MKITIELTTENTNEVKKITDFVNEYYGMLVKEHSLPAQALEGAAVPSPPQPQPTPPETQIDADGLPWDKRIHSRTPTIKTNGRWRQKRGVDPALVAQVTAELKGEPAQPQPQPAAVPAPPPPAEVETLPVSFPEFMKWIVAHDPKYNETDALNALVAQVGLPSIGLLAVNLEKIPTIVDIVRHS